MNKTFDFYTTENGVTVEGTVTVDEERVVKINDDMVIDYLQEHKYALESVKREFELYEEVSGGSSFNKISVADEMKEEILVKMYQKFSLKELEDMLNRR